MTSCTRTLTLNPYWASMNPELSVIVPAVNTWQDLDGCLDALGRQREAVWLEVVVANRLGEDVREALGRSYPWVRVVEVPAGTTIPTMRAAAILAATAGAV